MHKRTAAKADFHQPTEIDLVAAAAKFSGR